MNVAMMQPAFMPWPGYFELIVNADIFVFLDNFQFSVQSYHQRNRLFVDKGRVDWYIVPVLKTISFKSPLNETRIHEAIPWRKKMWMRIKTNYERCEYFDRLRNDVQSWLLKPSPSLASFNIEFIRLMCSHLGILPEFRNSSEFPIHYERSQRVLELLRSCRSIRYYCAQGAFPYMFEDRVFPVPDIEVLFQDFHQHSYNQRGSPQTFIPNLSVLDPMMNIGPEKTLTLIRQGTRKWLTWEEMVQHQQKRELSEG